MIDFDHLGGLGPKCFKMVPKMTGFDHLGGLGPKCFKMVPKMTDFDHLGGLGPILKKECAFSKFSRKFKHGGTV